MRKPFQGVANVVKFNWHFYVLAGIIISLLLTSPLYTIDAFKIYTYILSSFIFGTTLISLIVTYYIYDWSGLYKFGFLEELNISSKDRLVNINAGFDEVSFILADKFKTREFQVFDFYNPEKHTEISIERARKVSLIYPDTLSIKTSQIPIENNSVDYVFLIFAAHEIRNRQERIIFFNQLSLSLRENGRIVVVEHLRDFSNFLAYTIGFLHFFSKKEWKQTFNSSNLIIEKEIKITPFVSVFILQKNGITS